MSRQYANKFNEVLLLRTKNRVEDFHKTTGITKLMERNEGINRKDFDKFYKDHVAESIMSRNIRGLFRVPDDNKHLVVDAQEEKDDKEDRPSEQKCKYLQIMMTCKYHMTEQRCIIHHVDLMFREEKKKYKW